MTRSSSLPHRRFARSTALLSLIAAGSLALSGCVFLPSLAAGPDADDSTTEASPSPSPVESDENPWGDVEAMLAEPMTPIWSQEEYLPVGSATLAVIGETALAYVQSNDKPLALIAIDVSTGAIRWEQDAGINNVSSTGMLEPVLIDDGGDEPLVALLAPPHDEGDEMWAASLMLLDVQTGDLVAGFDTMWIWSYWECGLDRTICFWGSPPSSQDAELFTFSADDGVNPYTDTFDDYEVTRPIAHGLWAVTDDGGDEWLVMRDGDDEDWRVPVADIVDGTIVDGLVGIQTLEDGEILVLNVLPEYTQPPFDAAADRYEIFALATDTGDVLWQLDGYLACSFDVAHPVLCGGDIRYVQADPEAPMQLDTGAVDLHGFDPRTGEVLWTREFADLASVSPHVGRELLSFGDFWTGQDGDTISLTHRATGEAYELGADDVIGCQASVSARVPEYTIPGYDSITIEMGSGSAVCTSSSISHRIGDFTRAAVYGAGSYTWSPDAWIPPADAGITVVQTRDGFYGFDVR